MASVELGNGDGDSTNPLDFNAAGDSVGVVTAWEWPDPLAGVTTADLIAAQTEVRVTGP